MAGSGLFALLAHLEENDDDAESFRSDGEHRNAVMSEYGLDEDQKASLNASVEGGSDFDLMNAMASAAARHKNKRGFGC